MKVRVSDISNALSLGAVVAKARFPAYMKSFPEALPTDKDVVDITEAKGQAIIDKAVPLLVNLFREETGGDVQIIDNPVNPIKPVIDDIGDNTPELPYIGTGEKVLATSPCDGQMSDTSILQDKAVFKGKLGPDFGKSFTVVWSDGNRLEVSDSSKMKMNGSQDDHRKFQPGGKYSGDNPDIPYMEVYAKRGTHPKEASIVVKK